MKNLFRAARSAVKTAASAVANSDDVRFFAGPAIMAADGVLGSIIAQGAEFKGGMVFCNQGQPQTTTQPKEKAKGRKNRQQK